MKKILNKNSIFLILMMALFNFVFLCTEYLFDAMMGLVTDSRGVVNAQNIVLGASVIGFLLFAKLDELLNDVQKRISGGLSVIVLLLSLILMIQHRNYATIMITGIVSFVLFGIFGALVCYHMSLDGGNEHLAKKVGLAYALGVLIQYVSNNIVKNDFAELVVIVTGFAVLILLSFFTNDKCDYVPASKSFDMPVDLKDKNLAALTLTISIIFTTCIFSTLDNAVTLVHADGDFDIGQWPRLILALSGLLAGILFDISKRRFMSLFMYIITMLSTICVVIIQLGGPFVIGLIVFYISAGFFVVYFCVSYMDLSHYMNNPKIWAGLGRAVNNISAFAVSALSVRLLDDESGIAILVVAILLFAMINVSLMLYISMYKAKEVKEQSEQAVALDEGVTTVDGSSKIEQFFEAFSFTEREQEVFNALISSDENVQELAVKLAISRAALYRHISNMNKKTETQNRIGLIKFYFDWIGKN